MADATELPLGLLLGSSLPPEHIIPLARRAESAGLAEIWLAEDYFFTGGVAGAASALASTERIRVGIGIVSALVRHPAVLAMEISTLERMHPGRFLPGIGHGYPHWIAQMGLTPASSLAAIRECVTTVRDLLGGHTITQKVGHFVFDNITLAYPVSQPPPIQLGVMGPKMLQLSGEIANGTIMSIMSHPKYLTWAREHINTGRQRSHRTDPHRMTVFALYSINEDSQEALDDLRPILSLYLSIMKQSTMTDLYGIRGELSTLVDQGADTLAANLPVQWMRDLAVVGTPTECAESIRALVEAGADRVILMPHPETKLTDILELTARELVPRVRNIHLS